MTRRCTQCDEDRWIEEFRVLASGWRGSMCADCERDYDRARHYRRHGLEPPELLTVPDPYLLADEPSEELIYDGDYALALATTLDRLPDADVRELARRLRRHFRSKERLMSYLAGTAS